MRGEIVRLCRRIVEASNIQCASQFRRELSLKLGLVEIPKHSELLAALLEEVAKEPVSYKFKARVRDGAVFEFESALSGYDEAACEAVRRCDFAPPGGVKVEIWVEELLAKGYGPYIYAVANRNGKLEAVSQGETVSRRLLAAIEQ